MEENKTDLIDDKIIPGTILDSRDLINRERASLSHRYSTACTPPSLVELHVHLDGSFRHSTLFELAQKKGIQLPNGMEPTMENFLPYISIQSPCHSLAEFLEKFPFFTPIVAGDLEALERVAYEFVEDQAIQGVLYTETRYSPHYLTGDTLTPEQVIQAINRGIRRGTNEFHVDVRTLLCCMRHKPEWSMEIVRFAEKYRSAGVVGIDIAGDEHNYPLEPHVEAFVLARELGIHRTVHAGETGSSESVRHAIELCYAERIGHGYAIVDDPEVYELVRNKDVHLECCLTSSIQTNAIGKYIPTDFEKREKCFIFQGQATKTRLHCHIRSRKDVWHPIHHFARDNLNFSLSCDDPSVSQITIGHEYAHALADLKLTPAQLTQCVFNAARSTFLNPGEKQFLIKRLLFKFIPDSIITDFIFNEINQTTTNDDE